MPITPSGTCTRILTVADPAQPCGTANTALKYDPTGACRRSSVTCAAAGEAAKAARASRKNARCDIGLSLLLHAGMIATRMSAGRLRPDALHVERQRNLAGLFE